MESIGDFPHSTVPRYPFSIHRPSVRLILSRIFRHLSFPVKRHKRCFVHIGKISLDEVGAWMMEARRRVHHASWTW